MTLGQGWRFNNKIKMRFKKLASHYLPKKNLLEPKIRSKNDCGGLSEGLEDFSSADNALIISAPSDDLEDGSLVSNIRMGRITPSSLP